MTEYASKLDDFGDLFAATAQHVGLPRALVEKDYYVVRVLAAIHIPVDKTLELEKENLSNETL